MPSYLTQPGLSLARTSNTSFSASISGDGGNTHRLFYRKIGDLLDTTGPTLVGSGSVNVLGLTSQGQYLAYVVADDGISSYSRPTFKAVSLAATDSLTGAMIARFDANPITVEMITGGMWAGEVPEHVEPPYCHIEQSVATTLPNFVDEIEFSRVLVQVFALGYDNCYKAVRQLKSTYDYQSLTFSSFAGTVGIWPLSWRVYNERRRWRDNEVIHRGVLTWRVGAEKPRASNA